ncbi:MAG: hypothetical protein ACRDPS_08820, partial [Nocardioides sp.]|uniref:hypothetical protein n=1 Tax=Nocardioides sp. TaxID=35761 RepID=UPI003D6BF229
SLLVALVVYFVLVVAVSILLIVVARRTDKALMREVASASPAIAADRSAHVAPAPAQVVRRRISRKRNAYVAGYAPTSPPAIVMMLRVIAPEGARLAIALAPTSALGNRARSYVGVRLDPAHPDVAVLDSTAAPEAMKTQYESAMALPGFKKPPIGWGSTSLFALCGVAAGLLVGIGAGLLLP